MRCNKFSLATAVIVLLSLFETRAFAAGSGSPGNRFYFEETFFPLYVSKNDAISGAGGSVTQTVATESGLGIDARSTLGYVYNNVLLGLTYNMYSIGTKRAYTADAEGLETSTGKSEFGPTLGYFLGNWRLAFTFFLSASKTYSQKLIDTSGAVSRDEKWKNTDGSGFQFAFGYDFMLGAGFSISPTLVYRAVTYSKQSYEKSVGLSGTPYTMTKMQTKAIDNELKPMITLSWSF